MKRNFLIILILPLCCCAQVGLKNIRTRSWETFAYKITAVDAEKYMKWDSIPVNKFSDQQPVFKFNADSIDEKKLENGNYVLLTVNDNYISADLLNISNLQLLTINNRQQLQLDVKDKTGDFVNNCKIFVNDKRTFFNKDSKTFWVKQHRLAKAVIKVYTTHDTLYANLDLKDELRPTIPQQNRRNYHYTKIYKILNWIPSRIRLMLSQKKDYYPSNTGYIVFNQPKYRISDSVKFKAYMVNKAWKQYRKPVKVYLKYYSRGKYHDELMETLKPSTPGAYIGQFILADTIPTDINCDLIFKSRSGKNLLKGKLTIEEYVLDEIGSNNFRSEKTTYFRNDSMRFFASAKDANGLNVLDATATLILLTNRVSKIYQDTLFVADTLYKKEIKLSTTEETKFIVAASELPAADLNINAQLIFKNANNELQQRSETIEYNYTSKELIANQEEDSIKVFYIENGINKAVEGTRLMNGENAIAAKFPLSLKIDPQAMDYDFYILEGKDSLRASVEIRHNYHPLFTRTSSGDTLGFVLDNPYRIPIYFTILDNRKIIATGKQLDENITWKKILSDRRKYYQVRWQYIWAGIENDNDISIGLLYKILNINVKANQNIYPGQKDSLSIHITDYKGKPASNVNLTAVSYNNQFRNISVKDPPYLVKYKGGRFKERGEFENDEAVFLNRRYLLGKNINWLLKFHLDSMIYYKLLFPSEKYYDVVTAVESFVPQLSVNVVDKGVPQEIYLLYINRQLIYYNAVTDPMNYAFEVFPGMVQIGIRTIDKYIEIDSIYIQPHYKHDISFDLNNLPLHSKITDVSTSWNAAELNLLESTIWQMKNKYENNDSYLWQDEKVVKLSGYRDHTAGPFTRSGMHFFKPGSFDIAFDFEPGYEYDLSKQVVRQKKMDLFPKRDLKNLLLPQKKAILKLGDTLVAHPEIFYPAAREFFLSPDSNYVDYWYGAKLSDKGMVQFDYLEDSSLKYIILLSKNSDQNVILPFIRMKRVINLIPGIYTIILVTNNYHNALKENIIIKANGTEYVDMKGQLFSDDDSFLKHFSEQEQLKWKQKHDTTISTAEELVRSELNPYLKNDPKGESVSGNISDEKAANPIMFCTISIKGYRTAVKSDLKGDFILKNIPQGKYILVCTAIGYETAEIPITVSNIADVKIQISLKMSRTELTQVVVTALGVARQSKELGYSTISVRSYEFDRVSLQNGLTGKVAGINIQTPGNEIFADKNITLRGIRGLPGNNRPLFVVNGIVSSLGDINKINPNDIADVTVMKPEEAVILFGSQGANGAILVTTNQDKTFRKEFRDYAFWEPNFFTDKNGNAALNITYPDNVTGWKTFILAMDKKRRIGKTSFLTQAYKPMIAQMNLPQFLLEADSSVIICKSLNYTAETYHIKKTFSIKGKLEEIKQQDLLPHAADIDEELIQANNTDTITTAFTIESTTSFKDGEERKIPVFKRGTEETVGNFWLLENDTTVSFTASTQNKELNFYAQNNTLDVLLEELRHLREYPYACMEQMTSKLCGLAMEKKIMEQLKLPFKDERMMNKLLQKIQKAQLYEGGWSWWENGKANLYITNYITSALLQFRDEPLVETNIRNAFLYLHNELPFLNRDELLATLQTLSDGGHEMDYGSWVNKINFDSLTQHQQWQWIKIKQQQKMNYQNELKKLVGENITSMLGGMHWGRDNYSWYSNDVATTVIAFSVLKKEPAYQHLLPAIIRFFLEKKDRGFWINTVECATIINAILPSILEQKNNFTSHGLLTVKGDTSFIINSFPYKMSVSNSTVKNISISKSGGGFVYFTVFQKIFNKLPRPVTEKFNIHTDFEKNGQNITSITSGEKIKMIVSVEVLKDADYVMLQVPIPAGCIYADKNNSNWNVYKEFYKDKVVMFIESLSKGVHRFEIELQPRYNGMYTLNPAKAELMYYPVFFGRNEIKKVVIIK